MTLATSITEAYLTKSWPLFSSGVHHWHGRRICFTIGFSVTIPGWECVEVPLPLKLNVQPTNRADYWSLQTGEFTEYMQADKDEPICFVDSDTVLQRDFGNPACLPNTFYTTQCSFPTQDLQAVKDNLKSSALLFNPDSTEFCACFMIADFASWQRLYRLISERRLHTMAHHAEWQLIINDDVNTSFNVEPLPAVYCCASWYTGSPAVYKDGKLYIGDKLVYFNHTKFNLQ